MLVLPQIVKVRWSGSNKKWFIEKGYVFSKCKDEFEVNVLDLMASSIIFVEVKCDYCGEIILKRYADYSISHKENEDCCKNCKGKKIYKMKEKYILNDVKREFKKRGYTLLETEYINVHTSMRYICNNGHNTKITFGSFLNGNGCRKCYEQTIGDRCRRPLEEVRKIFEENNCILLTSEYINSHQKLDFICECGNKGKVTLSKFLAGRRCKECGIKRRSGENHHKYNSNLSDEDREFGRNIEGYAEWRLSIYERDKYTCQCCGDNKGGNLNAHHLDGYDWCIEKRIDIDNGITLCSSCHNDFHKIYGFGNNTKNQFEEWLNNK